ncbi:LruC domain-containing protein [Rhodocytophaga rosea]|uniref:LruC domain-containing protein n=1 Tax=Rhodocytophaga rosea TaxID=2704465 RepID=A0A6C0GRF4_9BACT|nr:LruC domain-containing protein [Rhodocytophaga rosea]QHT70646.1 LruC domain-containing protein [Rhodocytophaga rosea]
MRQPLQLFQNPIPIKSTLLIGACVFSLFACQEREQVVAPGNTTETQINEAFNFNTTQDVTFNIWAKDSQGDILNMTNIQIYDKDPNLGGELLIEGGIDNTGQLSAYKALPTHLQEVTIVSNYIGVLEQVTVPITDQQVSYTFGVPTQEDSSGEEITPDANGRINGTSYTYLGKYNSLGVPKYLQSPNHVIPSSFLNILNTALPEGKKVNPAYLAPGVSYDVKLTKDANVTITFVSERADFLNSLGYYTYPLNKAPKSVEEIDEKFIVFPNASFTGSGGGLASGNRVKLPKTLKAGTGIGFFIVSNGWNGSSVSKDNIKLFSNPAFNPGNADKKQHSVLLKYEDKCILAFEDIKRSDASSDEDFNDVLFYITTDPVKCIDDTNIPSCEPVKDCDKDGVPDEQDKYSCDPVRAYNNITKGTLAFEDLWPAKGDFDVNDLVVNYSHNVVTNSQNKVVELISTFDILAIGARYRNGLGFELSKLNPSQIKSVVSSHNKTILEGGQAKATILVFENAFDFVPNGIYDQINTKMDQPKLSCGSVTITTTFTSTLTMQELGAAPFNPFLICNQNRGYEVHLPGYKPTSKADLTLLGTKDDISNPARGIYYKTSFGMPYALNMPVNSFKYPVEGASIKDAYVKFLPWAASFGVVYSNWYLDLPGYRDAAKVYTK